jgi:flagellar hook-basal body complex protein FliE
MIDGVSALTSSSNSSLTSLGAASAAGSSSSAVGGADFGQIMNEISGDAIGSLKTAEAASIEGLQGTASVHKVVESIMSAQRSLQSALAIRDKVVTAYQEISRMNI